MNPGSIRGKNGSVSIWRIPNFLLEPRGGFFGEPDEFIGRLNKLRSVTGAVIVIGMTVVYSGLAHLGYTGGRGGALFAGTQNTPEGHWFLGLTVSVAIALLVVPLTSLALVLYTKPSARKATLYQLRWPFISVAAFSGLLAVMVLIAGAASLLTRHAHAGAAVVGFIVTDAIGIILAVWLIKALYLAGTGMFRADDGHPLLAPASTVLAVWPIAILMNSSAAGTGGLSGVPAHVAFVTGYGGAVTITVLSVMTVYRLRKQPAWPFRNGPRPPQPKIPREVPDHPRRALRGRSELADETCVSPVAVSRWLPARGLGRHVAGERELPRGADLRGGERGRGLDQPAAQAGLQVVLAHRVLGDHRVRRGGAAGQAADRLYRGVGQAVVAQVAGRTAVTAAPDSSGTADRARRLAARLSSRPLRLAIQAGAGRRVFDTSPAQARDALAAIEATSRETLSGLRRMVTGLRRAELEPLGPGPGQAPLGPAPGLADLEQLAAVTLDAGVQVDVDWRGSREPLPADIDLPAFRIIQEAITNVVRHAGTDWCRVWIDQQDGQLSIEVTDGGRGGPVAGPAAGTGYGITGMRERAALLGGDLQAGPRPGGGFRVAAQLPVPVPTR
jgi:Histidine kinase